MAIVPVSQVKLGEKLSDQVLTKRGNLLFDKGVTISARELEILKAFMIQTVTIESKDGKAIAEALEDKVQTSEEGAQTAPSPFLHEYETLAALYRKVMHQSAAGAPIPILDIRTALESLLQQIDSYNILTFSPNCPDLREYMLHDSIMVALTSYQLAKWHGFPVKDLIPISLGGLLHDIGNTKIDPAILEKKTKLTSKETEEMRKHTVNGYQILKNVAGINEGVKLCALQHHEREDGSGYPLGLKGDQIHPYAKVVAVADIFHAMTNNRYHKKAMSPYLVLEQLQNESFGKLDPVLVQTFIYKVTQFHNGTIIRLNDNRIGEIVFSDRNNPTRPWVNINGTIVNLTVERNLHIQEVIRNFS